MENGIARYESPTPTALIEKALEKGVDFSQLKELMDLQERWEKKEARKSFFDALSQFQSKCPTLKKTKTAKINSQKGFFSYKYADLGSITKELKKLLAECGLSYRWDFEEANEKLRVTCHVSHRDGHSEKTSMEAGKDSSGSKNDIQQKGSTQTYLQRYTLVGALGLSTADDDIDGKSADSEMTEEDLLHQWSTALSQVKTGVELKALYLKNKSSVESNAKVQAMFKAREAEVKSVSKTPVEMP